MKTTIHERIAAIEDTLETWRPIMEEAEIRKELELQDLFEDLRMQEELDRYEDEQADKSWAPIQFVKDCLNRRMK